MNRALQTLKASGTRLIVGANGQTVWRICKVDTAGLAAHGAAMLQGAADADTALEEAQAALRKASAKLDNPKLSAKDRAKLERQEARAREARDEKQASRVQRNPEYALGLARLQSAFVCAGVTGISEVAGEPRAPGSPIDVAELAEPIAPVAFTMEQGDTDGEAVLWVELVPLVEQKLIAEAVGALSSALAEVLPFRETAGIVADDPSPGSNLRALSS